MASAITKGSPELNLSSTGRAPTQWTFGCFPSRTVVKHVREEWSKYRLHIVVAPLTKFFDTLSKVYIRFNRTRMNDTGLHQFHNHFD
ncbi:hypothetical protein L596_008003 [Steinernema carpocapsae]|uniref:Uncharacterized protein n=1 Tax=Steinernema carpocapsae TaxID=34508 RepID=A0A4U5PB86_STECR|nr:hypothetical protein L596_008003 [Steinernema carpocapsae]